MKLSQKHADASSLVISNGPSFIFRFVRSKLHPVAGLGSPHLVQILEGVTEAAAFDIVDGEYYVPPSLRDLNLREVAGSLIQ